MTCECYPSGTDGGCNGMGDCHTLTELRLGKTTEGRAQLRDEYNAKIRAKAAHMDGAPQVGELLGKMQRAGIPSEVLAWLPKIEPRTALDGAKTWWRGDRAVLSALVLVGPPGCGKSVAAGWVALQVAKSWPWNSMAGGDAHPRLPFVWLDGPKLSALSAIGAPEAELMASAARACLLVVDDAGREGNRPAIEALSDVLSERIDNKRSTVLTSNLVGESFRNRYGLALSDRLRAHATVINLAAVKSMRTPRRPT